MNDKKHREPRLMQWFYGLKSKPIDPDHERNEDREEAAWIASREIDRTNERWRSAGSSICRSSNYEEEE